MSRNGTTYSDLLTVLKFLESKLIEEPCRPCVNDPEAFNALVDIASQATPNEGKLSTLASPWQGYLRNNPRVRELRKLLRDPKFVGMSKFAAEGLEVLRECLLTGRRPLDVLSLTITQLQKRWILTRGY